MNGIDPGDSWTTLLVGFIIGGAGIGMTNPRHRIGSDRRGRAGPGRLASRINSTFRQVGIATGVAALGAIFQARVDAKLGNAAAAGAARVLRRGLRQAIEGALPSIPSQFRDQAVAAADQAFMSGLNEILLIGAGIAIAGSIAGWLLIRSQDMVGLHRRRRRRLTGSRPSPFQRASSGRP